MSSLDIGITCSESGGVLPVRLPNGGWECKLPGPPSEIDAIDTELTQRGMPQKAISVHPAFNPESQYNHLLKGIERWAPDLPVSIRHVYRTAHQSVDYTNDGRIHTPDLKYFFQTVELYIKVFPNGRKTTPTEAGDCISITVFPGSVGPELELTEGGFNIRVEDGKGRLFGYPGTDSKWGTFISQYESNFPLAEPLNRYLEGICRGYGSSAAVKPDRQLCRNDRVITTNAEEGSTSISSSELRAILALSARILPQRFYELRGEGQQDRASQGIEVKRAPLLYPFFDPKSAGEVEIIGSSNGKGVEVGILDRRGDLVALRHFITSSDASPYVRGAVAGIFMGSNKAGKKY